MKLIKIIGRILLAIAGVILLAVAIPQIIGAVNYLNANSAWWNFSDQLATSNMWVVLGQGLNALGGVIALLACLIGRRSVLLALYAIVMMIHPVYTVVTGVQNGTITGEWSQIWLLIEQFAVPLLYFFGCLLV